MTEPTFIRNRLPDPGAGFVWNLERGFPVLQVEAAGVRAVMTTRLGGVSPPPVDSLNLSFREQGRHVGSDHDEEQVLCNRDLAGRAIGRDGSWSTVRQVHGARVVGAVAPSARKEADALWTDDPRRTIAILVADCVPVLLVAEGRIAAVHAGWRGLVAGVVEAAVDAVAPRQAWIGPAIGPCCYEVGAEVHDAFAERFGPAPVRPPRHVDLWSGVEHALRASGVERMHTARLCTSCHPELFFSHRRDAGRTGRQGLVAALGP